MSGWEVKDRVIKTQSQLPTPFHVGGGKIRMYYSKRDSEGKSHIKFTDLDEASLEIVSDEKDALAPGQRGMFDHAGVMPSCVVLCPERGPLMFYTGWHLKMDVPYGHAIGVAKIQDDGVVDRVFDGPVLSTNRKNPYLVNSPFVEIKNSKWVMHYCRGNGWIENYPTYNIWLAESDEHFNFESICEAISLPLKTGVSISRTWRDHTNSDLYFSWKTESTQYRLSKISAGSVLPIDFEIKRNEWDSEMQCYPSIYSRDSFKYMFYNGNGYGSTGIGVAKWNTDIG